ncbi:sigma-70 family RNA polymerase sigma factor [Cytobacillus purgationiresistens]|uniref:RNA polymerase sigma-70 factor (ECF subfamily) n=1 Tax=Cytobacillus purgationiresistens TaxID=863449 RepID=A0ABU0AAQ8_9BACI|nr:sigma-70 family RNA polymerase sigma factor [Cytobacillus purgationiresistens]MDQ0268331.1 RNA polymerase sigma-70 factor (ECF subfamily) [Cytobacillus purgationiresistens]
MNQLQFTQSKPSINNNWSKEEKLDFLMNEYGDKIIRLAYSYVRTKHSAEDIAQEVFIKCYEHLDEFRGDSSHKTWLYKIAINKCKDHLKSWSHRNVVLTEIKTSIQKVMHPASDIECIRKEEGQFISEKILSLPRKYREVIIFYYYEGLSLKEISNLLNLNINTIKSRFYRGKKLLEKELKGGDFLE